MTRLLGRELPSMAVSRLDGGRELASAADQSPLLESDLVVQTVWK